MSNTTTTNQVDPEESSKDKRHALRELVNSFDTGMLVTRSLKGEIRARPMQIVAQQAGGKLIFVTHIDDTKIDEILASPDVNVTLQDGKRYVSVTGTASVERNRDRVGLYYKKAWDLWFPEGVNDPHIVLIDVEPTVAEYWDGSGFNRLRYAIAAAKAIVNEEPVDPEVIDHETIDMKASGHK